MSFIPTERERAMLQAVQADLPDSATPFADAARTAGVDEAELLELLSRLKEDGVIRRFGASIKHQRAGWSHNVMVAWLLDREGADKAGPIAAAHTNVSHCYYRPSSAPDWPFTFYTMLHGRSEADLLRVIEELGRIEGLTEYKALKSLAELKKISMTYF